MKSSGKVRSSSTLREQIRAAGLTSSVTLSGPLPQEEVRLRLARSAIFALPCVTEADGGMDNLPTVIMEAMAAALPVVSTAIGGVPEMVQDGTTGFLLPEHQPGALADILSRLLSDPALRHSLGNAGRERAIRLFALDQTVQTLRVLFQQLGAL